MPVFRLHLRRDRVVEPDDAGMEFRDLHDAFLGVRRAIPDTARDLLIAGDDPMACAYVICDHAGSRLLEVPFDEVLSPAEWRLRRAGGRPHGAPRSARVRAIWRSAASV